LETWESDLGESLGMRPRRKPGNETWGKPGNETWEKPGNETWEKVSEIMLGKMLQ